MPNPSVPITGEATGVSGGTMITEKALMSPKSIGLYYIQIAKSCYVATGSKRIACTTAGIVCITALIPGAHQLTFIIACATAARGANKL